MQRIVLTCDWPGSINISLYSPIQPINLILVVWLSLQSWSVYLNIPVFEVQFSFIIKYLPAARLWSYIFEQSEENKGISERNQIIQKYRNLKMIGYFSSFEMVAWNHFSCKWNFYRSCWMLLKVWRNKNKLNIIASSNGSSVHFAFNVWHENYFYLANIMDTIKALSFP